MHGGSAFAWEVDVAAVDFVLGEDDVAVAVVILCIYEDLIYIRVDRCIFSSQCVQSIVLACLSSAYSSCSEACSSCRDLVAVVVDAAADSVLVAFLLCRLHESFSVYCR